MGRKFGLIHHAWQRGSWTKEEDQMLVSCIEAHGASKWSSIAAKAGLKRSGKSCRLRWLNYLRPDIKRGNITEEEEELIIRLHKLLGNRWSLIAGRIPGRTDNEIKNYWNKVIRKRMQKGGSAESHVAPAPWTAEASRAEVAAATEEAEVAAAAEEAERCTVVLEPSAAEVQAVEDYNWSNSLATADDDNPFFGAEENFVAGGWAAGESGPPLFCAGRGDLLDDLFGGEEELMYCE